MSKSWNKIHSVVINAHYWSIFTKNCGEQSRFGAVPRSNQLTALSFLELLRAMWATTLFVIPRVSKSRMGGRAFSYQAPLLWNQLPAVSRKQTPSLPVRLGYVTPSLTLLSFFPLLYPHMTLCTVGIVVIVVFLFQQVSFKWCYGVCCPLFVSNLSCSRQMATLPESGSARCFFLLKGSRFSQQSPHACSGWEIGPKRSFGAICWFP